MKNEIKKIIWDAAKKTFDQIDLSKDQFAKIILEEPKHKTQGDFSTNFAMVLSSFYKTSPQKIAKKLISQIPISNIIKKIEIAGAGFINFFLTDQAWQAVLENIFEKKEKYGSLQIGKNKKVQIEFVSANPTGPLHAGHGRGAVVGDCMANILLFAGFTVEKEYYINDSGRQIKTLGKSVWLRILETCDKDIDFPDDCYKGNYIKELADDIIKIKGKDFILENEKNAIDFCARFASKKILSIIKQDLKDFGVEFDQWFREQSLFDSKKVQTTINDFKNKKLIYKEDKALWFDTKKFGDEKNRVVVKSDNSTTYFASDIAYHIDKYERGFDKVINVWGADHHGYIKRLKACILAYGKTKNQFEVILVQLVNLQKHGKPIQMSTRAGKFVSLRDIINEVGKDAARFIFLSRSHDSHLDFDLSLAKQKNNENPVYYVQYVYARITGILLKAKENNMILDINLKKALNKDLLTTFEEINLLKILSAFQDNVEKSALTLYPNVIFIYLMQLASAFHNYYNKHKVITDDKNLTIARLSLISGIKMVISNALNLLGVAAPKRM